MTIQIFNTLKREKEPFMPIEEGKVKDVCMWTNCLQLYSYRECTTCNCL